jgi:hypothetical protein
MADFVSLLDAASTAFLPNASMAAVTAGAAPYIALVVMSSWATSA